MLVQQIKKIPDEFFVPALREINSIDWISVSDPSRSTGTRFTTSTSIHLRQHKVGNRPLPQTIAEWCVICECEDNNKYINQFQFVRKLADYVYDTVGGQVMGRIMITNLLPHGVVPPHIDPLDYFEMYSRFHVPFKTNLNVVFNGGENTPDEHMPYQHLCRLNNRQLHKLENRSDENRIHLIIDIAQQGGNVIF